MVRRRAVGASVAAAFLFSVLLLSNAALLVSSQGQEQLAAEADEVSATYIRAQVAAATYGLQVLDRVQAALASGPMQCSSAVSSLGRDVAMAAGREVIDSTVVQGEASLAPTGAMTYDAPLLQPFNGSKAGDLGILMNLTYSGSDGMGEVRYSRSISEVLSLPVSLPAILSVCGSLASAVQPLLSNSSSVCSERAALSELAPAESALSQEASAEGLGVSLSYEGGASTCHPHFLGVVRQPGVSGPDGPFTVTVEQQLGSPEQ